MERRSVMFVGFSAEEIGLGGSAWFVEHLPSGKIGDIAAMINLDMVGRMNEHKLNVLGADSAKAWDAIIAEANKAAASVNISAGGDGYGPSDHSSFYAAGVPVVHLFTGAHEQYHSPEDDAALLNIDGGADVARITAALAEGVRRGPRPDYVRTSAASPTAGDSRGYGAYFGSVPDYSAMEATTGGVKLTDEVLTQANVAGYWGASSTEVALVQGLFAGFVTAASGAQVMTLVSPALSRSTVSRIMKAYAAPTSATALAVWWGLPVGRWAQRSSENRPPSEATAALSRASVTDIAGNRPAKRWASIDLPEPGGPISSRLWPPAAAISSARLAAACPLTSDKSA